VDIRCNVNLINIIVCRISQSLNVMHSIFNYVACLCICVCTWSFQKVFHEPSSTCIGNYNVGESNAIGVPLEIPTIKHSQAMKVHSLMNIRNVWDRNPLKWQPMNHWSHLALFKVALKNKLHWSWVFLNLLNKLDVVVKKFVPNKQTTPSRLKVMNASKS
jgi:hypothetical protein